MIPGLDKVRRLQLLTLAALVALVAVQVARWAREDRVVREAASQAQEALDRAGSAVGRAAEVEAAARRATEGTRERLEALEKEALGLGKRAEALEKALFEARAALAAAGGLGWVDFERRFLVRIRSDGRVLDWRTFALPASGPDWKLGASAGDELGSGTLASAGEATIPLGPALPPLPGHLKPARAVIFASAVVEVNNAVHEKRAQPKRLALVCTASARQGFDLAASCFWVDDRYGDDSLRKASATSGAFVVDPKAAAEVSLLVDAGALAAGFEAGGEVDVVVRLGPVVTLGCGGE